MLGLIKYAKYIALFLALGLYTFGEELVYFAMKAMTLGAMQFFLFSIPIAFDVALEILSSLNLSAHMVTSWSAIPLEARQAMAFFRIPEVLSILITVALAKFVMRFVPFVK